MKTVFWASRDKRSQYLFDLFKNKFNIAASYNENLTVLDRLVLFGGALNYFYPDFRKYRQISICSPFAVDYRAKKTERAIRTCTENIDFIFQFGASYPPMFTKPPDIPYFVYTDSCCNPDDKTFPWRWRPPNVSNDYTKKQSEVFSNATKIFTHSRWAKELIIKVQNIDESKIIDVGSGPILTPPVERVDFSAKENMVLFVGGDFIRKGVDVIRKSLDIVVEKIPSVSYIIIGKNSDNLPLASHPQFNLLGPIYDREILANYYKKAKLFTLASRFEPLGHVLWEAMSFSTPIIVANTGGMPETVIEGYNGFTFPVGDHEALAECIIQVLSDDSLASHLSYNARSHFEAVGKWEHVVDRIIKVIEGTL